MEGLWEIMFLSNKDVYTLSSKFLHLIYKSLSPDLQQNFNKIKEEFL